MYLVPCTCSSGGDIIILSICISLTAGCLVVFCADKLSYKVCRFNMQSLFFLLFSAAAFTGLYVKFGFTGNYVVYCIFFVCLIMAGIVDLRLRILPNIINAAGLAAAFVISLVNSVMVSDPYPVFGFLAGGAACGAPLLIIAFISRRGMGMGDVKFAVLIGAFLGVYGGLCAIWLSIVLGGLYCAVLIAVKKATRKTPIPFGPFMALGALAMVFFGDLIKPLLTGAYHV